MSSSGSRRAPAIGADEARTLLGNARKAFIVMVGVLALLWIIQVVNAALGYHLTFDYGIVPRDVARLPDILSAPFLHFSWTHIEGNSGPLFIFGFLAAYRGLGKFAAVSAIVVLTSGFAAWLFESPHSVGAGASGVVFGYFGYIMVRGLFDRRVIDVVIGAVMALCFAYQFAVLLPHQGIGWQAHVGGLAGGIVAGWLLRDRSTARAEGTRMAVRPAPGGQPPATSASGTVAIPGPAKKGFTADPANPRADLHKQLDDLGL